MTRTSNTTKRVLCALLTVSLLVVLAVFASLAVSADDEPTFTVTMTGWTWGDETLPKGATVTGLPKDAHYTVFWQKVAENLLAENETVATVKDSAALPDTAKTWDAGDYRVVVTASGYSPVITGFTIEKKTVTGVTPTFYVRVNAAEGSPEELTNENNSKTYNGKAAEITAVSSNVKYGFSVIDKFCTNAGEYTLTAVSDDPNLDLGTYTATYTVLPAENPFFVKDEDKGITVTYGKNPVTVFSCDSETVIDDEDLERSVFSYSYDGGKTWTTRIPTAELDVGEHQITYRAQTPNAETKIKTVKVTVKALEVTAASLVWPEYETMTYKGSEFFVNPTVNGIQLSVDRTVVDAGAYTVTATVPDALKANVKITGEAATHAYTVSPLAVKIAAQSRTISYLSDPANGGVAFLPAESFDLSLLEQELLASGTIAYSYNYEKGNAPGTYSITVTYTPNKDAKLNYTVTTVGANLYVKPIEVEINWIGAGEPIVYDGEIHEIKATFLDADGETVDLIVTTSTAFRDAGTYRAYAALPEEGYEYYVLPVDYSSKEYVIQRAKVNIPAALQVFRYNGEAQTIDIPESEFYEILNGTRTKPGTQEVQVRLTDRNHEWADGTTDALVYPFTINKALYDMSGVTFPDVVTRVGESYDVSVKGTLPTGMDGSVLTVTYENIGKTAVGKYTVTARFATNSIYYETPEPMTATLTIRWVEQDVAGEGETGALVKVRSANGLDPDVKLIVTAIKVEKDADIQEVLNVLSESDAFGKNDRVFTVYDVSLEKDNVKVQPDGTLTIYLTIPEELVGTDFRILHVHGNETINMEYTIDEDGYAVVVTDQLSAFAFVHEQTSLLWLIILLSVLSALLAALLGFQIWRGVKSGLFAGWFKSKGAATAAAVFFLPGHVPAVIVLSVLAGVLLIANAVLFVLARKKNA